MKKFITVAALVAAGTALASAASWEQVSLDTNYVTTGTSTLEDLGMTGTYNYDEYSWVVSFNLNSITTANNGAGVFVTYATGMPYQGYEVLVNTGNGRVNIADSNGTHIGEPNMNGTESAFDSSVNDDPLTFYLYWNAQSESLYLYTVQSGDLIWTTTIEDAAGTESLTYATLDASEATFRATTTIGANEATTLPITGIAVYVSSVSDVPEPSMFGLLAGLGAIGLVATRRRRNRKA